MTKREGLGGRLKEGDQIENGQQAGVVVMALTQFSEAKQENREV